MAAGVAGGGLRYGTIQVDWKRRRVGTRSEPRVERVVLRLFTPTGQARDVVLSPEQLARLLWDGAAAMARVVEDLEAAAVVPDGEDWHS